MAPKSTGNKSNKDNKGNRGNRESTDDISRLLSQVLQAVTELKKSYGCTTREILTQLKSIVRTSPRRGNTGARRLVVQVRRALRHGVYTGLLKQRAGRYMIASKGGPAKHKTERGKNQKRDKRRRSPTKSPSRSTQGESTTENDESPSSTDASTSGRSRSRTKRERRTKRTPKQKQRKDSKERSKSQSSSKSKSRNQSEPKKGSQPKSNDPNPDDPSTQQQTENEVARASYMNCGRHRRLKRFKRDLRHQQMDEDVMCDDQNNDQDTPERVSPDCLGNLTQEPREPSPQPEPEQEPDPGP